MLSQKQQNAKQKILFVPLGKKVCNMKCWQSLVACIGALSLVARIWSAFRCSPFLYVKYDVIDWSEESIETYFLATTRGSGFRRSWGLL